MSTLLDRNSVKCGFNDKQTTSLALYTQPFRALAFLPSSSNLRRTT